MTTKIFKKFLMVIISFCLSLGMLVSNPGSAVDSVHADSVIVVDTFIDELETDGNCSIREAIQAANTDLSVDACPAGNGTDTIVLSAGKYTFSANIGLAITSNINLEGAGMSSTIVEAAATAGIPNYGVLSISNATVDISGLTIRHGNTYGSGGGIYSNSSIVTLYDVAVMSNWTHDPGGGIFSTGPGSSLTIIKSVVSGNLSDAGGGIFIESGSFIMTQSLVSENTAVVAGAGIGNHGTMFISNSTISGNIGSEGGGGIDNWGTAEIRNSTVSNNHANNAGGLRNFGTMKLANTISANNSVVSWGPDCVGRVISLGYNLIGDSDACDMYILSNDIFDVDPLLGPLQDNGGPTKTHLLHAGSPAINAGNPTGCLDQEGNPLNEDQRGMPRNGRCDIGSFEVQPIEMADKTVNPKVIRMGETATYTIVLPNNGTEQLSGVTLIDQLPASVVYIQGSLNATSGTASIDNRTLTWAGDIPAGDQITITYSIKGLLQGLATNTVEINGGGETIFRSDDLKINLHILALPCILTDRCVPIFVDDFSKDTSGWPHGTEGPFTWDYSNGEYIIQITSPYYWAGAHPGILASNYRAAVTVRSLVSVYTSYGILFGISEDWNQFYMFEIDNQSNYAIYRYTNGNWTAIAFGTKSFINKGTMANRLAIERNGATIKAYVNNQLIENIYDSFYQGPRYVGLITVNYDKSPGRTAFDNFGIYPLECTWFMIGSMPFSYLDVASPLRVPTALTMFGQNEFGTLMITDQPDILDR